MCIAPRHAIRKAITIAVPGKDRAIPLTLQLSPDTRFWAQGHRVGLKNLHLVTCGRVQVPGGPKNIKVTCKDIELQLGHHVLPFSGARIEHNAGALLTSDSLLLGLAFLAQRNVPRVPHLAPPCVHSSCSCAQATPSSTAVGRKRQRLSCEKLKAGFVSGALGDTSQCLAPCAP
jgi:hypothetical protein